MGTDPAARRRSNRALGIYLGAVMLPTLALLYLGYQSVQRQGLALEDLTRNNERLSSERLAAETERRVLDLAGECFRDPALIEVAATLGAPDRPDTERRIRTVLQGVATRHPLVAALFLAQGDAIRFPLLHTPLPRTVASYVDGEPVSDRPALLELLQEADRAEVPGGHPDAATAIYQQVLAKAQSPPLRALALARLARVARQSGDRPEVVRLYRRLFAEYPDEYDPFHQPYALVAAQELRDLEQVPGSRQTVLPADRESLRRDLARGRWEVTPDIAENFRNALRLPGHGPDAARPLTSFEIHFKVAEAFAGEFARHGALRSDRTYPLLVEAIGTEHQMLYSLTPGTARAARPETIVALDVDLNWVKATLLPEVARRLEMAVPTLAHTDSPGPGRPVPAEAVAAAFPTLFPFWHVVPSSATGAAGRTTIRRETWVFAGATLLVLGVLVIGVVLLIRDVSRERQLNRFKADLVAGVSHELKTPLTIIRLYAETLGGSLSLTGDERREYSDIITRESDRLTTLIDRVLSFSRLEQRGRTYSLAPGDLKATLTLAVDVFGASLHRRGFDVTFEPGDIAPVVCFDPDAVLEAVLNLLDNAAKYSGESRWIGVRLARRASDVVVEVEDRGPGIDPKDHDRIFQEYYRGDGSAAGHGLGLYLVQHIMAGHGGRVEVESEPGRGSTFRLVFPPAD